MITVRELATKLAAYANSSQGNGKVEVMLAFDGDMAFPFLEGQDNMAMGASGITERFLVLMPDLKGKRLMLKGKE